MTSESQGLLDAIRIVVREEVSPLHQRFDTLTEHFDGLNARVDGLTERFDRIEIEQREQRFLLQSIDLRLTNLEARVERLEDSIETIDTRTGQLAGDLLDLKDRLRDGLRALKRESELALRRISEQQIDYRTQRNRLDELEDRVNLLQQRLDTLEARENEP
jgi:chromosome segregation ATPase